MLPERATSVNNDSETRSSRCRFMDRRVKLTLRTVKV